MLEFQITLFRKTGKNNTFKKHTKVICNFPSLDNIIKDMFKEGFDKIEIRPYYDRKS